MSVLMGHFVDKFVGAFMDEFKGDFRESSWVRYEWVCVSVHGCVHGRVDRFMGEFVDVFMGAFTSGCTCSFEC